MKKIVSAALALLTALFCLSPMMATRASAATDYSTIRVRLSASTDDIDAGIDGIYTLSQTGATLTGPVNISLAGDGVNLVVRDSSSGAVLYTGPEADLIRGSGMIRQYNTRYGYCYYLGNMKYQVQTTASTGAQRLVVTNTVGLEDYLLGVVGYEMSDSFPLEALKVQAICARSYAACKISPSASYDVVDTSSDQVYHGYNSSQTNVIAAVNATQGQVIANSAGEVVYAYYSASNGGQTETTENAWGTALPYYQMKDDPYDLANPSSIEDVQSIPKAVTDTTPLSAEMEAFLKQKASSVLVSMGYSGFADTFSIVGATSVEAYEPKYDPPSRCYTRVRITLLVSPTGGGITSISPPQFMTLEGVADYVWYINENRLVTLAEQAQIEQAYYAALSGLGSAAGTVSVTIDCSFDEMRSAGLFTNTSLRMFYSRETTTGYELVNARYGHGVGMSQRGAQQMANEGRSYTDILYFYYSNVTIQQISTIASTAGGLDTSEVIEEDGLPQAIEVTATVLSSTGLLSGPGASYGTTTQVSSGEKVDVVGQFGDYFLVIESGGKAGYLASSRLSIDTGTPVLALLTADYTLSGRTLKRGSFVQLMGGSGTSCLVTDGTNYGTVPQSLLEICVGSVDYAIPSGGFYGYATSMAPMLRSRNSTEVTGTIEQGEIFTIRSQTSDRLFYNITFNGQDGVIYQSQTQRLYAGETHPNPKQLLSESGLTLFAGTTRYVNTQSLNLRAQSTTSSTIVETLSLGERVSVLAEYGDWSKVQAESGIMGFVSSAYLSSTQPSVNTGGSTGGGTIIDTGTGSDSTNTGTNTGTSSSITGTVTASSLNIRASKSTSADILGTVPYGATVTLLTQTSEWYKITYNGITGYVSREYVTRNSSSGSSGSEGSSGTGSAGTSSAITGTVTASSLNIRASKSTSADILGTVPYGATVTLLTQTSEWYKITYNGITGYVSRQYVTRNSSSGSSGSEGSSGTGSAGEAEDPSSLEAICAGTVTASSLALRQEPDEDSTRLATASSGAEVEVLGISGDWLLVRYGGLTGYMSKEYVDSLLSDAKTATVNTNANFRSGPSTETDRLGVLTEGSTVYVLSESDSWSNVLSDGTVGYVLSRYLDEGGSSQGGSSSGGSSTGGGSGTAGTVVATGVTTTSVNLRASASTESASLAVIPGNTTVGIIAQSGNFYKVSYNGAVGYVQKTYLGNIKQSTGGGSSSTQTELEKGRVTASSLNVRASASSSGTLLDRLEYGTIVEIVAKRGDFYQIKYGGGAGYVSAGYVEIVSDGSIKETTASVNFRSGPGTSYESLGTLPAGTLVEVLAESGSWAQVRYGSQTGYVSTSYLQ